MLGLRDLKVLLVEDDPELARTLERVLARHGHRSTLVGSVSAALSLGESFDCGVLDIELPDGNGLELAERLLDDGLLGAVVFYSACADVETRVRARQLGPFVDKASGAREVERALADALSCAARQVAGSDSAQPHRQLRTQSGSRRKATGPR
jgi:DNA-binding response OmpR family regulator